MLRQPKPLTKMSKKQLLMQVTLLKSKLRSQEIRIQHILDANMALRRRRQGL